MLQIIIDKINVKSASLLISFVTIVSGIIMVILQIKDEGFIDIKSAVISGQIKSGFVGITLIFLGVVICLFCISFRGKTKLEVSKGDMKVSFSGAITHSILRNFINDAFCRFLGEELNTKEGILNDPMANKANAADAKSRAAD